MKSSGVRSGANDSRFFSTGMTSNDRQPVSSYRRALPASLILSIASPFEGLAVHPERLLSRMNGPPEWNGD